MPLIVINPLRKSIADSDKPASLVLCMMLIGLIMFATPVHAVYPELRISADRIDAGNIEVHQVAAQLAEDGTFSVLAALAEISVNGSV